MVGRINVFSKITYEPYMFFMIDEKRQHTSTHDISLSRYLLLSLSLSRSMCMYACYACWTYTASSSDFFPKKERNFEIVFPALCVDVLGFPHVMWAESSRECTFWIQKTIKINGNENVLMMMVESENDENERINRDGMRMETISCVCVWVCASVKGWWWWWKQP